MKLVKFDNELKRKDCTLVIYFKYGYELIIPAGHETLKILRANIMWHIDNDKEFYNIQINSIDSMVRLSQISSMTIINDKDIEEVTGNV